MHRVERVGIYKNNGQRKEQWYIGKTTIHQEDKSARNMESVLCESFYSKTDGIHWWVLRCFNHSILENAKLFVICLSSIKCGILFPRWIGRNFSDEPSWSRRELVRCWWFHQKLKCDSCYLWRYPDHKTTSTECSKWILWELHLR